MPSFVAHGDAHAVAVRVGGDDEVGAFFVGELHAQGQGLGVLRVGRLDGGEAAVHHVLLGDGDVIESEGFQRGQGQHAAGAVDGREDDASGPSRRASMPGSSTRVLRRSR